MNNSSDSFALSCELKGVSGNVYALRAALTSADNTLTTAAITAALVGIENHINRISAELEG
ncbi:MAG: hypothetical protein IJV40_03155 [Oscillospiraceae bacterium]|nr:hypothetical protein [Oscillospiraceae bacterium]